MNEIIQDARRLYKETYQSPQYADILKTQIWDQGSGNYAYQKDLIDTCETPENLIERLKGSDMYAITIRSEELYKYMMDWHLSPELMNKYPALSNFNRDFLTPNLCKMVIYANLMARNIGGRNMNTFLELGGGNGQLHRVLRLLHPSIKYVDIDIPETLYCAYVSIRHWHPTLKVGWMTKREDAAMLKDCDVVLVPHFLKDLAVGLEYDIFMNTASLGEMPNETIRMWISFVEQVIQPKYLFCFNRFLNTVSRREARSRREWAGHRINENECSVIFDKKWEVLEWEVEPDFSRCPYEDPRIARYLLVIMKRLPQELTLVNDYLNEVQQHDWWRYRNVDATATNRSNQLVNDFTMQGPLFKLWEAMRLNPNAKVAEMIIEYFKHISKSNELAFEEEFFYAKYL